MPELLLKMHLALEAPVDSLNSNQCPRRLQPTRSCLSLLVLIPLHTMDLVLFIPVLRCSQNFVRHPHKCSNSLLYRCKQCQGLILSNHCQRQVQLGMHTLKMTRKAPTKNSFRFHHPHPQTLHLILLRHLHDHQHLAKLLR